MADKRRVTGGSSGDAPTSIDTVFLPIVRSYLEIVAACDSFLSISIYRLAGRFTTGCTQRPNQVGQSRLKLKLREIRTDLGFTMVGLAG